MRCFVGEQGDGKKSAYGGGSLWVVWGLMRGHHSPGIIKKVARSIQSNATVQVLPGLARTTLDRSWAVFREARTEWLTGSSSRPSR
jgi:uncharacterized protein (DUF2236 family)